MRLAQLDRAFGYGPKGRGFESSNAREEKEMGMRFNAYPFLFVRVRIGRERAHRPLTNVKSIVRIDQVFRFWYNFVYKQ